MNPLKNHLEGQSSPYLLQHLYNPVDWYPWGPQALERARIENKPLLISIGYSACHWCHVMEKESFEDHEIAGLMNEHFICIKVDREERPDIDHIYMNAVQMISGRGGWPLNCFALPDGRPFWGGTYFPKEQWRNILNRVAEIFQTQRGDLEEQAEQLTQGISASSLLQPDEQSTKLHFPEIVSNTMANAILAKIDMEEGGMQGAPKFPLPAVFEFLLHYYHQKKDSEIWSAILLSLQKMAMGGIFDQVGGGFARYATDAKWKIPHFEKMLYDNAQLISLYAKAWMVEPDPIFRQTVEHTLSFVHDELLSPAGTFYSALDADSEGEEGKFYVWQEKEFRQLLGQEADMAARYYSLGKDGFWENGNNILLRSHLDKDFAKDENLTLDQLYHKTLAWNIILKHARDKRIRPGLDNKVLISWNGLMITALTDAYRAFGDSTYKERAVKATQFIMKNAITEHGQLFHTLTHDKPAIDGFLEDYASMTQALIALYQVTFEVDYLQKAKLLAEYVLENFSWTDTRMFSFSSSMGEKLIARYHDFQDNVIPSANSTMARSLFYLGHFYENNHWVERSLQMLHDMKPQLEQNGSWTANWGILWLHQQKPFYTLAICGHQAEEQAGRLANYFLPDTILCAGQQPDGVVPLLMSERFVKNKTLIYPCTFEACGNPAQNPEQLLQELFD